MPLITNGIVGYPIDNNEMPENGAQAITLEYVYDDAGSFQIDLRASRDLNELDSIQSVHINNFANDNAVTLTVLSSGQRIVCPAFSGLIHPVYGKEPVYLLESVFVAGTGTNSTRFNRTQIMFVNVFQPTQYLPLLTSNVSQIAASLNNASGNQVNLLTNIVTNAPRRIIVTSARLEFQPGVGDFSAGVSGAISLGNAAKIFASSYYKFTGTVNGLIEPQNIIVAPNSYAMCDPASFPFAAMTNVPAGTLINVRGSIAYAVV